MQFVQKKTTIHCISPSDHHCYVKELSCLRWLDITIRDGLWRFTVKQACVLAILKYSKDKCSEARASVKQACVLAILKYSKDKCSEARASSLKLVKWIELAVMRRWWLYDECGVATASCNHHAPLAHRDLSPISGHAVETRLQSWRRRFRCRTSTSVRCGHHF
jgi:hypothetical protein